MSGFVGIVHFDGSPVDRQLLKTLTEFLSFRGPDAQETWCEGPVGLGHTLLRVSSGISLEKQPVHLDRRVWIVADARIDARSELIDELKARAPADALSLSTPDTQLILHAYDTWGEGCVEHLLGDFSFAIWDARERRLFCARDQFGVKPFYYAHVGPYFIFSNTLNCIRAHPAVSSRLNDLAIADFLLFDMNQNPSSTSFSDIQRLPPAHALICERRQVSVRRYWELCVTTPLQFRREEECTERFRELLDAAVADRLRAESAGVLMSGGLDSPSVAASAKRVLNGQGNGTSLSAYTEVISSLIPHEEQPYARLVAEALQIPIEYSSADPLRLFEHAGQLEYRCPEPVHTACSDTTQDHLCKISAKTRVILTGLGADPALCGRISVHFKELLRAREFGRAISDAVRYLGREGGLSRLYLRKRWRILFGTRATQPFYPNWLNVDFEKRLDLRERWESSKGKEPPRDAVRAEAQQAMSHSMWPSLFEGYDSGVTRALVEVRHPFFDLHLVNFILALPRLPWCSDKELLREAARGVLPEKVRLRRKSPLQADPLVALLQRPESAWVDNFRAVPELERYVVRSQIPNVYRDTSSWRAWIHLKPLSLNFWLHTANKVGKSIARGVIDDR